MYNRAIVCESTKSSLKIKYEYYITLFVVTEIINRRMGKFSINNKKRAKFLFFNLPFINAAADTL